MMPRSHPLPPHSILPIRPAVFSHPWLVIRDLVEAKARWVESQLDDLEQVPLPVLPSWLHALPSSTEIQRWQLRLDEMNLKLHEIDTKFLPQARSALDPVSPSFDSKDLTVDQTLLLESILSFQLILAVWTRSLAAREAWLEILRCRKQWNDTHAQAQRQLKGEALRGVEEFFSLLPIKTVLMTTLTALTRQIHTLCRNPSLTAEVTKCDGRMVDYLTAYSDWIESSAEGLNTLVVSKLANIPLDPPAPRTPTLSTTSPLSNPLLLSSPTGSTHSFSSSGPPTPTGPFARSPSMSLIPFPSKQSSPKHSISSLPKRAFTKSLVGEVFGDKPRTIARQLKRKLSGGLAKEIQQGPTVGLGLEIKSADRAVEKRFMMVRVGGGWVNIDEYKSFYKHRPSVPSLTTVPADGRRLNNTRPTCA